MASSLPPTPLVNSALLTEHANETIRIIGKVVNHSSPTTLTLQASDKGHVEILLSQDSEFTGAAKYIEVVGKATPGADGLKVKEFSTVELGDELDLDLVEHTISMARHLPALFTEVSSKMEE